METWIVILIALCALLFIRKSLQLTKIMLIIAAIVALVTVVIPKFL